jgi:thiamine biosynthesis protein ThiS
MERMWRSEMASTSISFELNEIVLQRAEFETTILYENDRVELLYFMGGGRGTDTV